LGLRTLAKKRGCAGLLAEYRSPLAAPSASSRRPILFLASLPPYLWNTRHSASVAPLQTRRDTEAMSVLLKRALPFAIFAAIVFAALPARADEIRLKDGKKLYGVIVAYEDNMFKVKTDFGYVLVEKDKIAAIIPTTPASAKKDSQPAKPPAAKSEDAATQPAVDHTAGSAAVQPAIEKAAVEKKPAPKVTGAPVRPEIPAARNVKADAPVLKNSADTATPKIAADSASPAPPKEPDLPPNREEIQGNTYTNFTHHFRMYKAPSWQLIEDARRALPNAIVAMGTSDQSTLLVIGEEKTPARLDAAAPAVEERLRDVYENYRRLSEEKITVAGQPAIEYKYRGMADGHDWSGTLVVISHGSSTLTVLGMTYADSDLIQIQENVIARAIASLDFSVQ